jgi:Recombinase/Recombinase zinc beta ribbon domain/Resolvase, N terminal domain
VLGVGGGHHQPVVPIRPPAAQHRVGGLCNGPVGDRPEDALLVQFQGMIAEYEKAQIIERTRRGKAHRAKAGVVNVLWGAPYGYRYVRKSDHAEARYELVEPEASVARELFRRYTHEACSIADLARWLSEQQIPTRTGKARWDRSTVWGMLRNPAYAGRAAFSKTMRTEQRARLTRPARLQGRSVSANPLILDRPREDWVEIAVPPIVSEETFQLAARRLAHNQRFAARNAKVPSLLQGLAACQGCGYAYYRTSTRTTNKKIYYYRCLGSDDYRYLGGRVCANLPVRADYLDQVVWEHVTRLLADPTLVRAELDRRLAELRAANPATATRARLEREQTRTATAISRLLEAYQEQLLSLAELRSRMPALRAKQQALAAQLDALDAQLVDQAAYLKLAETLDSFLARLHDKVDTASIPERQRVLRLLVKEVLIGPDRVVVRHRIPVTSPEPTPGYLLRGRSQDPALGCAGDRLAVQSLFAEDPGPQERLHQSQHPPIPDPIAHAPHKGGVVDLVEARCDVRLEHPLVVASRCAEEVDLSDGVLGSAPRAEAVGARLEVRLEDRLQHQLQGGLDHPVCGRRDAQAAQLAAAARLGDRLLPHPGRGEAACLERCSQPAEELPGIGADDARNHPIDPGGASALIAPHPAPRHDEERRVIHEVVQVIEATTRIGLRPLVQLGLHPMYPPLGLLEVGPQIADVHRRAPSSASLPRPRWGPSPCGRLSRPRTTTTPPPHPGSISRPRAFPPASGLLAGEGPPGWFPRSPSDRSSGSAPSYAPAASPRLRRSPSPWPPGRRHRTGPGVPRPSGCAPQPSPDPSGSSWWFALERRYAAGSSRTPSRLARRTRTI